MNTSSNGRHICVLKLGESRCGALELAPSVGGTPHFINSDHKNIFQSLDTRSSAREISHGERLDLVRVFASQQVHLLFFWPVTFAPSPSVTGARGKVCVYICVGVGGLLAERGANDRADYSPEPELSLALPGSNASSS